MLLQFSFHMLHFIWNDSHVWVSNRISNWVLHANARMYVRVWVWLCVCVCVRIAAACDKMRILLFNRSIPFQYEQFKSMLLLLLLIFLVKIDYSRKWVDSSWALNNSNGMNNHHNIDNIINKWMYKQTNKQTSSSQPILMKQTSLKISSMWLMMRKANR